MLCWVSTSYRIALSKIRKISDPIFAKSSILGVWHGFEYASEYFKEFLIFFKGSLDNTNKQGLDATIFSGKIEFKLTTKDLLEGPR